MQDIPSVFLYNDNGIKRETEGFSMNIEQTLAQMTVEEKAALVSGTDFMYTNPIPRLGIPSLCMSDGPHGLRKQLEGGDNGVSRSEPATAFPTAACTASGWNPENTLRMGAAIAEGTFAAAQDFETGRAYYADLEKKTRKRGTTGVRKSSTSKKVTDANDMA